MPNFEHVIETKYVPSFRSEAILGMFDVPKKSTLRKEWHVNLPIEEKEWHVGLIVGASGSGKTQIANKIFKDKVFKKHEWNENCFLDDFDKKLLLNDIVQALSHVGFSSPPLWLLPYKALSNGQQFRADLARAILESKDFLVFDEFSSVVDRTVAQTASFAVQKFIRKQKKQFVAVTCHYDVEEWLQPDWVFDVSLNKFKWGCLRRPTIEFDVKRVHHRAWHLFKGHHYLSADLNKSSRVYVAFLKSIPVALCAILHFPHKYLKNFYKEHRTVVLPDFQGVGIGNKFSEYVGELLLSEGKQFISTTSHPSMIHHRQKSKKWLITKKFKRSSPPSKTAKIQNINNTSVRRLTCSFKYVGEKNGKKK